MVKISEYKPVQMLSRTLFTGYASGDSTKCFCETDNKNYAVHLTCLGGDSSEESDGMANCKWKENVKYSFRSC